jgi:pimeloyl-ACP methyl ester carboxylesterase
MMVFAWLMLVPGVRADELVTFETRPGVSQSMMVWEPHGPKPETVFLVLPGGPGNVGLKLTEGHAEAEEPYLFSGQREVLLQGNRAVVVLDAPSDQEVLTQEFRLSPVHVADLRIVLRKVHERFPGARVVVIGHSLGTLSAAVIAKDLADQVHAVVLFSGLYEVTPADAHPAGGPGLSGISLPSLKVPLLLVHHVKDACPVSPFAAAKRLSPRLPLLVVDGAADDAAHASCGNPQSKHWLAGQEQAIGREMLAWLSGRAWKHELP